jgi:hypothetical protein
MESKSVPSEVGNRGGTLLIVVSLVTALALGLGLGIASLLCQGRDTRALRACLLGEQKLAWRDRIIVNGGPLMFGAIRLVSRCLDLPPEARAGVASLRGAEVGVFRNCQVAPEDRPAALIKANETMVRRGWSRVVAVQSHGDSVVVYVREKGLGPRNLTCCVVVWNENELVVVQVKSEPEPLLKMVTERLHAENRLPAREVRHWQFGKLITAADGKD